MLSERLPGLISEMDQIEAELQGKVTNLKSDLASAETELKKVRAARKELGGKQPAKETNAPKKADVVNALKEVLEDGQIEPADNPGILDNDALQKKVKAKLKAQGFSLAGFALRYKEAKATFAGSAKSISSKPVSAK